MKYKYVLTDIYLNIMSFILWLSCSIEFGIDGKWRSMKSIYGLSLRILKTTRSIFLINKLKITEISVDQLTPDIALRYFLHLQEDKKVSSSGPSSSFCFEREWNTSDFSIDKGTLRINQGKGRKDRLTVFFENLKEGLLEFMEGKSPSDYLFTSTYDNTKKLSVRTVQIFATSSGIQCREAASASRVW